MRLTDFCIPQLKAEGPSRTCDESKEEEENVNSLREQPVGEFLGVSGIPNFETPTHKPQTLTPTLDERTCWTVGECGMADGCRGSTLSVRLNDLPGPIKRVNMEKKKKRMLDGR